MNNNRNNEEEAAGRQPAGRGLLGKFRKREDKTPPEILSKKENTDRFTPPRGGLILLQALILIFFFVFVPRFWFLQVHLGEDFARQAQENHWRQEQISAPRGRIFDVKGRVLADNRTAYGLSLIRDDIRDLPATLAQVSEWTGVPLDQVRERYRQSRFKVKSFEPLLLVTDLDFQLVARIESELYAGPGLEKDLFAHILGYVAEANETELEKNPELSMGDLVGKSGIEYTLDKRLRGRKGLYDIEVDASGRMLGQVLREEPQGGEELKLSLDRDIQKACWDALGTEVGSIVVMEPDTGKLRALVTEPAYDNNLFAEGISRRDWENLRNDPHFPLQNRAIQSVYPPGSVWKLVMAACIMENGIPVTDTVYCPGGIRLGKQIFHCWRHSGHGSQNLMQAIYNSCDSYFYIMADRLGIDKIESFAKQCGFGRRTGIDLPQQIFIGEENNLSVNFVNKSRTDIYNLSAKLNCEGLSNNGEEQYLGNLASGTTSSADFYITGNEKCELVGEVIITYEDTNMNQRTVSVPFTTQVTSYEDVWGPSNPSVDPGTDPGTDPGMEEPAGFPWFWVIGGVVVVAAGVFVYLKLRKNKKESVDEDEDI